MTLREVRFQVTVPGRRTEELTVVTSLTDPEAYPKEDIAQIYGYRWNAELDIRDIKRTLSLDGCPLQDAGQGSPGGVGDASGLQPHPQADRDGGGRSREAAATVGLHLGLSDRLVVLDAAGNGRLPGCPDLVAAGARADRRQ